MRSLGPRIFLAACSVGAVGFGGLALMVPLTAAGPAGMNGRNEDLPMRAATVPKIDSLLRLVTTRTPFRASRRPAAVAFDPNPPAPIVASNAPKPVLTLSGIVWSGDPTAVIQGLPGIEGSKVVRRGDVVAGLKVSRIDRERVWVTGLDTVWTLAVREPWK